PRGALRRRAGGDLDQEKYSLCVRDRLRTREPAANFPGWNRLEEAVRSSRPDRSGRVVGPSKARHSSSAKTNLIISAARNPPARNSPARKTLDLMPLLRAGAGELVDTLQPGIDFSIGFILPVPVALLKPPGQLCPLAFDHIQIVIGELAPLLLHLALELLPVTFHAIPIHRVTPCNQFEA